MIELAEDLLAAGIEFHNLKIEHFERDANGGISDGGRVRQDRGARIGLVTVTEPFYLNDDLAQGRIESWLAVAADRNSIDRFIAALKFR